MHASPPRVAIALTSVHTPTWSTASVQLRSAGREHEVKRLASAQPRLSAATTSVKRRKAALLPCACAMDEA